MKAWRNGASTVLGSRSSRRRTARWLLGVVAGAVAACNLDSRSTELAVPDGGVGGSDGFAGSAGSGGSVRGGAGGGRPETITLDELIGSGGSAQPAAGGNAGVSGEARDGGGLDTEPPSVISVTPAEGSSQVQSEQVRIVFSEPMERASVQAAFPDGEGFAWVNDDTEVSFRLSMPFAATPQLFNIVVPASVRDRAGNGLIAEVETSVVLASSIRVELPLESALSGNQVAGDNGNYSFVEAGDTAAGLVHYGGLSFALAPLPPLDGILGLRRATLHLQVSDVAGDPNNPLMGGFSLDRVSYAARADIDQPVLAGGFVPLFGAEPIAIGRIVRLDVSADLQEAWAAASERVQYRFGPRASDGDAVADIFYLRRVANEDDSVVSDTLPDPDPDNVARIEIEYFQ